MNRVFQIKVLRHQMVPETSEISTNQAAKKKKRKINNCEEINYHTRDKTKKSSFPFSLPSSKLTISRISIYKPYAIDTADTSSMQDTCHMNFVVDFPHRGVSVALW